MQITYYKLDNKRSGNVTHIVSDGSFALVLRIGGPIMQARFVNKYEYPSVFGALVETRFRVNEGLGSFGPETEDEFEETLLKFQSIPLIFHYCTVVEDTEKLVLIDKIAKPQFNGHNN